MVGPILSSYFLGKKIGKGILSFWYGTHSGDIQHAYELLEEYEESGCDNNQLVVAAITSLLNIPNDEKKYLLVGRDLLLACAYCHQNKFSYAYKCIDRIEAVEVGFFTTKSDTIREIQSESDEYRKTIRRLEEEYKRNNKKPDASGDLSIFWKIMMVVVSVLIGLLIGLLIFS